MTERAVTPYDLVLADLRRRRDELERAIAILSAVRRPAVVAGAHSDEPLPGQIMRRFLHVEITPDD